MRLVQFRSLYINNHNNNNNNNNNSTTYCCLPVRRRRRRRYDSGHAAITTADRTETNGRTTVREPFRSTLFSRVVGTARGRGRGWRPRCAGPLRHPVSSSPPSPSARRATRALHNVVSIAVVIVTEITIITNGVKNGFKKRNRDRDVDGKSKERFFRCPRKMSFFRSNAAPVFRYNTYIHDLCDPDSNRALDYGLHVNITNT